MDEMTLEQIKQRLLDIDEIIKNLEKERDSLTKRYISSDTDFYDRFRLWYNTASKENQSNWLPPKDKFPLFRKKLEDSLDVMNRYATYNLESFLEDELYVVFNYDQCVEQDGKEAIDKELEENRPLFEELMNNNLFSFNYDW